MYFEVETITQTNQSGYFKEYKTYKGAYLYAIKQSLKIEVIETFLTSVDDDEDGYYECQEYYKNGIMIDKII